MLPLQNLNPPRRYPILTYTLICINVVVFLWEMGRLPRVLEAAYLQYTVIPANISAAPFAIESILDVLRSAFMHVGWVHLSINMLYLWLFGRKVEEQLGEIMFFLLYFASAFAAAYVEVYFHPTSTVPVVGASGAISGVLAGYLLLFPSARMEGIMPVFLFGLLFADSPAYVVIGMWFLAELVGGMALLRGATYTIAFFAHIGGFVLGAVVTGIIMLSFRRMPRDELYEEFFRRFRRS